MANLILHKFKNKFAINKSTFFLIFSLTISNLSLSGEAVCPQRLSTSSLFSFIQIRESIANSFTDVPSLKPTHSRTSNPDVAQSLRRVTSRRAQG